MLALPRGAEQPAQWPMPELKVARGRSCRVAQPARPAGERPPRRRAGSRRGRTVETLAERRSTRHLPASLTADGFAVWVLGGPGEKSLGERDRRRQRGARSHRQPICATPSWRSRPASVAVSNDSGLLHVAAALGHAFDRHFRSDQPVALGAAQSARRGRSRPRANSTAGRATSRCAGSATTAACATSSRRRSWPRPAARSPRPAAEAGSAGITPYSSNRRMG